MTALRDMYTVDGDGHVIEPADLWLRYIEPEYRDRALQIKVGHRDPWLRSGRTSDNPISVKQERSEGNRTRTGQRYCARDTSVGPRHSGGNRCSAP